MTKWWKSGSTRRRPPSVGARVRLFEHAIREASALGITTPLAFPFAQNAPSLGMFRKVGFGDWGCFPAWRRSMAFAASC